MTQTTPKELPRDFASMADRTAADERELIVEWLRKNSLVARSNGNPMAAITLLVASKAIEDGDHARD